MCASNNYVSKNNSMPRKQFQSSQLLNYRSQRTNEDAGFDDESDDNECKYIHHIFFGLLRVV